MRRLIILVALAFAACGQKKGPVAAPPMQAELKPVDLPATHPQLTPLPDPEENGGKVGRAPRRLTVQQLKNSIPLVTGRQWSQIDTLAPSLGKADFALVASESSEPNLVFAKFLEDGAREVCLGAARDDLNRPRETRALTPELPAGRLTDFTMLDEATIQLNLSTLALKAWGQAMSPEEQASYTQAFRTFAQRAKATGKPEQAWGAVCVAMLTDPRFFTY